MSADPNPITYKQNTIIFPKFYTCNVFIIPWSMICKAPTIKTKIKIGKVY
jgi:hypothetical protein